MGLAAVELRDSLEAADVEETDVQFLYRQAETFVFMDNNNYEQWQLEGSMDANTRAIKKVREMLKSYQAPDLDSAVDEELKAFIERRESELPKGVD